MKKLTTYTVGIDELLPTFREYVNEALRILDITEEEATRRMVEYGDGGTFRLEPFIRTLSDTRSYPETIYYAKFHVDDDSSIHHGWCFDAFALVNGHEVNLLEGLSFADSINGTTAAFFVSAILPTVGAFWHGLYGRNYEPVESLNQLNQLFGSGTLKQPDEMRSVLGTSLGLRVEHIDGKRQCRCLCHSETEGLLDIVVEISESGRAGEPMCAVLAETSGQVFY